MASSGYTAITFIANEQPTTAKWNLIGSNDASFNNGNGFEDKIIKTRHLGSSGDLQIPRANFVGKGDYSTSEVDTGYTWINGKTIYRKTVAMGTLPASTSKTVAHGVTGIEYVVKFEGVVDAAASGFYPLNISSSTSGNSIGGISLDGANLKIATNASVASNSSYITIFYTKV